MYVYYVGKELTETNEINHNFVAQLSKETHIQFYIKEDNPYQMHVDKPLTAKAHVLFGLALIEYEWVIDANLKIYKNKSEKIGSVKQVHENK